MSEHHAVDPRTPVLVGVGTAQRRTAVEAVAGPPVEPVDLMVEAASAALDDANARGLVGRLGSVAVPAGNWSYADPGRLVADRLGATRAATVLVEIGVPQSAPIRVAAARIARGELDAALVVGGEAKATQLQLSRAGLEVPETDQGEVEPDERWSPPGELMAQAEIDAGIWQPVEQYACIDNALRHAEGIDVATHLDEIAALWERFNRVAATFPDAAFPEPRDAAFLRAAGPGNRPLAFPYAKWHSTQWAVDQAGAMVLCSAAVARELGVPVDRWVFPRVLVESSFGVSLTRRAELHRWPAMRVLADAAATHLRRPLTEIDHTELYSCFPAAVRVQQRELGLPTNGTPTVMGGMAFAGGPFNNFSYQSTAAIVERLRDAPGTTGMVTTVSGLLTKPGLAVWSTEPGGGALIADLGDLAAGATATREVTGEHRGAATVATYTVTYAADEPSSAFVIADLDDGRRWIGTSDDPDLLHRGIHDGLIGATVQLDRSTCSLA